MKSSAAVNIERSSVNDHPVVSREKWLESRTAFLAEEKQFTHLREQLSQKRRELPWLKVEKPYVFDGPKGKETLAQLFEGRSQLIVYHFMFGPASDQGCPHCSFWADSFNGGIVHLNHRDTTMIAISRAPMEKIAPFKERMGWAFKWVSSGGNDFNYDFGASFTPEQMQNGTGSYNYSKANPGSADREGLSVFYKDAGGDVFHTYSTYARGIDAFNCTYQLLDLVPKGRDERNLDHPQDWVRHHDRYRD